MKKEAKLKEKKSEAWKQRQGEQKQAQAKKQKKYVCYHFLMWRRLHYHASFANAS